MFSLWNSVLRTSGQNLFIQKKGAFSVKWGPFQQFDLLYGSTGFKFRWTIQFPGGFLPLSMPLTLASDQQAFASKCSGPSMRETFMWTTVSGTAVSLGAVRGLEVKGWLKPDPLNSTSHSTELKMQKKQGLLMCYWPNQHQGNCRIVEISWNELIQAQAIIAISKLEN